RRWSPMGSDHLRQYRVVGLLVGAVVLAALLILVRADAALGRAAATLPVCPSATYTTIQAAVDAAKAGDRIVVCAGTFTEQLLIDKSVTLVGAGPKKTRIAAPSQLVRTQDIVEITGSGVAVELSGFTIAGPVPGGSCEGLLSGIFVRDGAHASIHDNDITA